MAAQLGTIAVQTEDGLLGLFENHRLKIQVGDIGDAAGAAQIQVEMGNQILAFPEVPFLDPAFGGVAPETLRGRQAIHRLSVDGVEHPFPGGHWLHGVLSPERDRWNRIGRVPPCVEYPF